MKKKHLNTLKIASLTLMLGCFAVGSVYNNYQKEQQNNIVKVEKQNKVQPKYASYDDDNNTITLTTVDLENNFTNLAAYFNEHELYTDDFTNDDFLFKDTNLAMVTYTQGDHIVWMNEDYTINFVLDSENEFYAKFTFSNSSADTIEWVIYNSTYYNPIKSAIELDIEANQPTSMGDSIIGAITSGLGMIPDLASEFLTGFSTLFWNSTTETLTTFGLFSLVFLGIAITMAVIKLVLAIIRGNTGA